MSRVWKKVSFLRCLRCPKPYGGDFIQKALHNKEIELEMVTDAEKYMDVFQQRKGDKAFRSSRHMEVDKSKDNARTRSKENKTKNHLSKDEMKSRTPLKQNQSIRTS